MPSFIILRAYGELTATESSTLARAAASEPGRESSAVCLPPHDARTAHAIAAAMVIMAAKRAVCNGLHAFLIAFIFRLISACVAVFALYLTKRKVSKIF